ncbi:hypothetical protein ACFXD5_06605 [Streptomyces sp. NPDC059385]|uniref:hypothetical protein n=1 Tax=Streptomyces sp. NPDC059385 TaxID=3346817 RepID=UPI00369B4BEE
MYLVYKPEGNDEPQRWRFDPKKLMSAEREALEKRTGKDYQDFIQGVIKGNSLCRRALLHMYLKRDHPGVRYEDVDFAWGELDFEHSRQELEEIRKTIAESASPEQRDVILAKLDEEIATAIDDLETEGKAGLPIVG